MGLGVPTINLYTQFGDKMEHLSKMNQKQFQFGCP